MLSLIKKLEQIKSRYSYWSAERTEPESNYGNCSPIGEQCHGDGQCDGDGD